MKQVLLRDGAAVLAEVPAPAAAKGQILIRTHWSVVSAGTETAVLETTGRSLAGNALSRPDQVRRALEIARRDGYMRTFKRIQGMLQAGVPTGYSASGEVVEVGPGAKGFAVGQRVAAAGAGFANHAEIISVPSNLVVHVPDSVSLQDASTATLGAIALQGVRRTEPSFGETVAVIGLGLLGQLTVQLLRAQGCRVIGIDLREDRVKLAMRVGADIGVLTNDPNLDEIVSSATDAYGVDAAIITASSRSDQVVRQAMSITRKRGRVTIVGDVGLGLQRSDMYEKELDLRMSTSYGPGRYDPEYELNGHDYPLAHVRWTENRNMKAYLEAIASGGIKLAPLPRAEFNLIDVEAAYASTLDSTNDQLFTFLRYEPHTPISNKIQVTACTKIRANKIRLALVGASSFAQAVHLPNLMAQKESFELAAVVSRTPTTATDVAKKFGAEYATTQLDEALSDPNIDLVFITTRHDLHGPMVKASLLAGKHVFVEKPLTLNPADLDWLEDFYSGPQERPLLTVGYNRRFSPAARMLKARLDEQGADSIMLNYLVNAGPLSPDHWTKGPEGGGRNLGEACHMYDLMIYLLGFNANQLDVHAFSAASSGDIPSDNFTSILNFGQEKTASLTYSSLGSSRFPKESVTCFASGDIHLIVDFKRLDSSHQGSRIWHQRRPDKGHIQMLSVLSSCLTENGSWPIPLDELLGTSRISFKVEGLLQGNQTVSAPLGL